MNQPKYGGGGGGGGGGREVVGVFLVFKKNDCVGGDMSA